MFRIYYASAIDTCTDKALEQIEEFKKIFSKYTKDFTKINGVYIDTYKKVRPHPIEIYGAGFGINPIIDPNTSSDVYKGVVTAYDLRKLRECDILLVVTDLQQFCAGTMIELEYARQLGLYIIVIVYGKDVFGNDIHNEYYLNKRKVKNIFLETLANKIIYSLEELEEILKELTK